ncbi:MAG: EAL domain-containing protein [Proteobacteria bacterium]|nr:EAL domain-containing protein [Pseudomonadota bacterium]
MLTLDIRTLSFLTMVSSLLLALGLQLVNRTTAKNPGLSLWAMGATANGAGFVLVALRGIIPDLLSIVGANTLLLIGAVWFYLGNRAFQGRTNKLSWPFVLVVATAVASCCFTYLMPSLAARIVVFSIAIAAVTFPSAIVLLQAGDRSDRLIRWFVAAAYLTAALFLSARAVLTLFMAPEGQDFMALASPIQTFSLVVEIGLNVVLGIGLPLLVLRQTHRQFIASEDRYRTLVERDLTEHKNTEEQLRIAATAFEAQEGMFITNAEQVILRVNRAFSEITGYSAEEAVGQTPRLLNSGRHNADFFAAIMKSVHRSGAWQGEIWNRRKNGEVFPEWLAIAAVKNGRGKVTHYVATLTDITSRKAAEDEINNLAFYDPLTRLPNRRLLLDRVKQALASSARNKRYGALLFIDLDNFKTLNDTLGHDIGDLLLQQVSQRLVTCVREGDTVSRLGGDEFVVMLEDLSEHPHEAVAQAKSVGEKIIAALNQTFQLASHAYHSTPSIGVTLFADHLETIDELLKRADLAMYQAKAAGRNTLRFFDPKMQAEVMIRAELEADLHEAVLHDQFHLYYQAQVDGEGGLTGVEALVRWQHPLRGLVSPLEFIPMAEETGLILPLGIWVLETACRQLAAWAVRPEMACLTIAVNVSARQFHHRDFVDQVLAVLDHTGADPQRLKLELTESLLVNDVGDIITKMMALKEKGVGFSLDDFGTGYSSLSYLKRLPLDQLKIDQGFVRDILVDTNDSAIAKMVIALARSMGLAVIAEGVEIEAQRAFLASQGCHAYQGYLFSRPLPLDEFEKFMTRLALPPQDEYFDACPAAA